MCLSPSWNPEELGLDSAWVSESPHRGSSLGSTVGEREGAERALCKLAQRRPSENLPTSLPLFTAFSFCGFGIRHKPDPPTRREHTHGMATGYIVTNLLLTPRALVYRGGNRRIKPQRSWSRSPE